MPSPGLALGVLLDNSKGDAVMAEAMNALPDAKEGYGPETSADNDTTVHTQDGTPLTKDDATTRIEDMSGRVPGDESGGSKPLNEQHEALPSDSTLR